MTYTTYNASGNTFVIFDTNEKKDYSNLAIKLCQKEAVDGLIAIIPHKTYDFEWLFYNSDGSTASMCGNGTRAVAHYAFSNKIAPQNMSFLTGAGVITCSVEEDIVETLMTPAKILQKDFEEFGFDWWLLDTGVPHLVAFVNDLDKFDLETCRAMRKKYNANVNFAKIENSKLFVRTFERGVENETQACGTGMCACFVRAVLENKLCKSCKVYPKSNEELILRKEEDKLYFKGRVQAVQTKELLDENI
jgi:diaminopimelate epimerase